MTQKVLLHCEIGTTLTVTETVSLKVSPIIKVIHTYCRTFGNYEELEQKIYTLNNQSLPL